MGVSHGERMLGLVELDVGPGGEARTPRLSRFGPLRLKATEEFRGHDIRVKDIAYAARNSVVFPYYYYYSDSNINNSSILRALNFLLIYLRFIVDGCGLGCGEAPAYYSLTSK